MLQLKQGLEKNFQTQNESLNKANMGNYNQVNQPFK